MFAIFSSTQLFQHNWYWYNLTIKEVDNLQRFGGSWGGGRWSMLRVGSRGTPRGLEAVDCSKGGGGAENDNTCPTSSRTTGSFPWSYGHISPRMQNPFSETNIFAILKTNLLRLRCKYKLGPLLNKGIHSSLYLTSDYTALRNTHKSLYWFINFVILVTSM